jgi:hypothetical protein
MLGVLALLTGWALLLPLILVIFVRLGGPYAHWMSIFIGIAASAPLFAFSCIGGVAMIVVGVRQLAQGSEPLR